MCRWSSEVIVATGGGSALAIIATFAKVHWNAIKDRKAFKEAKERGDRSAARSSIEGSGPTRIDS